ncbi:hypothetical protein TNCT_604131 [Trichonephila clavata]|uniref:Uncharacterized protein n=1 Tax=Trichonephila clavata TaxID=2740835 RepID=A0A8X6HK64_TRICU|nr:hypothetical protein TNCT_604131 [Trichonephila clavata]
MQFRDDPLLRDHLMEFTATTHSSVNLLRSSSVNPYGPLPSISYGPLPSGPLPSVRAGGREKILRQPPGRHHSRGWSPHRKQPPARRAPPYSDDGTSARQHGHVAGFARDVVVVPVRSAVDGSRLDERQHRGPAEAGDTRSRRTQHGTNQRRVTPSEATAGPQSSTKLGRRRLPPDNMDTLQASHATSSSFRLAPQSTAVASTRGNIVVPQNGTIYYDRPGCQSTGRYKYDHPGYQSTGRYTTIVPANPARTGRVRHECPSEATARLTDFRRESHLPVPGFARDVVTVRSAVDLLGGGPGCQSTGRYKYDCVPAVRARDDINTNIPAIRARDNNTCPSEATASLTEFRRE